MNQYVADAFTDEILRVYQASKRGVTLYCHMEGDRIRMAGKAALYSIAEIAESEKGL